jgi:hypothetical protein
MGSLAGAAVMLPGGSIAAGEGERAVIARLAAYSARVVRIPHGSEVRLVASIDNLAGFLDGEVRGKALPYDGIRAKGNVLSFVHAGTMYRLENVLPDQFESRVRDLAHNPARGLRS